MLKSKVDNRLTDKDTYHSYLDTYETLFARLRDTASNVLEIGIWDGGSISLWSEYFLRATIHAFDITFLRPAAGFLMSNPRINLTLGVDAYSDSFIAKLASARYDVIIDDGPHTLESMKVVVSKYSQLLTENGLLIVEDVPNIEWIDELRAVTPVDLAKYIQVYDLRGNKGRYDDILFVINKTA